ncbi:MAG: hypothetical protein HYU75_00500 [Betaproteobacteria bacterium]|nr:hypothetical protein [Betaproteobacteria bacterium]
MDIAALRNTRRGSIEPQLLGVWLSIIAVSVAATAAVAAFVPGARSERVETTSVEDTPSAASHEALRESLCASCGTLVGAHRVESSVAQTESEPIVVTYRVTVRMVNGSYRTVSQSMPPAVSPGGRVRILDGTVIARS